MPSQTRNSIIPVAGHRYQGWLTTVLLTLMLFQPLLELTRTGALVMAFLGTFTVLTALYAVSWNNRRLAAGLLLAIPSFLTTWSFFFRQNIVIGAAQAGSMIPFLFYTLVTIFQHTIRSRRVGLDELFGALNVYILFGITWGLVYYLLELNFPGSFDLSGSTTTPSTFIYFSFSTLGTLGIGDIRPVWPFVRALSIVQMLFGLFFVTVLFGKLVSVFRFETLHGHEEPAERPAFERTIRVVAKFPRWTIVFLIAGLDLLTSVVNETLQMPLFLDTWATSAGAILAGPLAGVLGGALYNLLMAAFVWGMSTWVWVFNSAFVALLSYALWRRSWLDLNRPLLLIACGFLIGLVCAISGVIITSLAEIPRNPGTLILHQAVFRSTGNVIVADIVQQTVMEGMDKVVSLFIAMIVVFAIGELRRQQPAGDSQL